MDGNLEQMFKKAFPFWEDLTEKQRGDVQANTVRNLCPRKTSLHFGGGECAGVQIIAQGRARVFITSPGGGDITLFRLLEGDVSILSAACMLNGMDIELDMEMETDCVIYTVWTSSWIWRWRQTVSYIRYRKRSTGSCMMRAVR